ILTDWGGPNCERLPQAIERSVAMCGGPDREIRMGQLALTLQGVGVGTIKEDVAGAWSCLSPMRRERQEETVADRRLLDHRVGARVYCRRLTRARANKV